MQNFYIRYFLLVFILKDSFFLNVWQKAQRNGLAVEPQEEAKVVDGQELPEVKTDKVHLF